MDISKAGEARVLSPEDIGRTATAFKKSRILLSAFELDLFTVLGRQKRTSHDVAVELGTNPRATDRLLNALCALGLIRKDDGYFSNTESATRFLVKGEKEYMSGMMHTAHLWRTWNTMTGAIKKGGRAMDTSIKEEDPAWTPAFIEAMNYRAVMVAEKLVSRLDLAGVKQVLDVGGGSGAYAIAFVKSHPDIVATVFDLPGVIRLTKQYIAESGMTDRISTVSGDYHEDDLGTGFDLVFLSAIIHSNSPDRNRALIEKGAKALNPGGRIIIQDFIVNEDRTGPLFGVLFALNMIVGTEAGDTYTESEVKTWLMQAGVTDITSMTGFGPTTLIMGRKKSDEHFSTHHCRAGERLRAKGSRRYQNIGFGKS
ncbi:MAG: methyltransferase domain-containing protein [Deltaproteobacteria bacterium]|nr:methyltransferase domain-containing protein [Deltaproteobacteria bacterium]